MGGKDLGEVKRGERAAFLMWVGREKVNVVMAHGEPARLAGIEFRMR
jgi:hypothetical protein